MTLVTTLFLDAEVSGADISPDGQVIAFRGYRTVWMWTRPAGETIAEALLAQPCTAPSPDEVQGESIALADDWSYFTISEGANPEIFYVPGRLISIGDRTLDDKASLSHRLHVPHGTDDVLAFGREIAEAVPFGLTAPPSLVQHDRRRYGDVETLGETMHRNGEHAVRALPGCVGDSFQLVAEDDRGKTREVHVLQ